MLFSDSWLRTAASLAIAALSLTSVAAAQDAFEYPYGSQDVSVVATLDQRRSIVYTHGFALVDFNITVQLAVKNTAYVKDVGIRYTNASWTLFYEAPATYVKKLDDNYELWTVLLQRGAYWSNDFNFNPEYEIAAYVSYNKGVRSWDPLSNYYVYKKATAQNPVTWLGDSVSVSGSQVLLQGSVRTFSANRAADYKAGNVIVRWSTDNWKTFTNSPAVPYAGNDTWSWSIPVSKADLSLAPNVTYAIQYKPASKTPAEFWSNNQSRNYVKALRPTYSINDPQNVIGNSAATNSLTGLSLVTVSAYSDLPLGYASARVDNDAFQVIDTAYDPTVDHKGFEIAAYKLADGPHTFEFKIPLLNGPDVLTGKVTFTVKNKLKFKSTWLPAAPAGVERSVAWSIAPAADGKILVGWDRGYATLHDKYGSTAAPQVVYKVADGNDYEYFFNLAAVGDKVYGLTQSSRLYRWFSNGTLDTTWANAGTLSLNYNSGVFGSKTICYAATFQAIGESVIVADSCNNRLIRFDASGKFTTELDLGRNGATMGVDLRTNDVVVVGYGAEGGLLLTADPTHLGVKGAVTLKNTPSVDGVVVTKSGTAVTTSYNGVSYFDATFGDLKGSWAGFGLKYDGPGSLYIAKTPIVLQDGSVAVLSVEKAVVQTFAEDLLA
ncbi:hypothetical protein HDU96_009028 [Phlyctochytrium bullatum]|nr:hypothetical protein HDU96_009028 [Phlyctochytrium bullatum]